MTNDPEAIRKALEPHGYEPMLTSDGVPMQYSDGMIVRWSERLQDYCYGWDAALARFLNDKSQTGAKQEWLLEEDGYRENFMVFLGCDCDYEHCDKEAYRAGIRLWNDKDPEPESFILGADTIDEATNKVWLKVHGLEDPR